MKGSIFHQDGWRLRHDLSKHPTTILPLGGSLAEPGGNVNHVDDFTGLGMGIAALDEFREKDG